MSLIEEKFVSDVPHPSHGDQVRVNKKTFNATCPKCNQVMMFGHPLRGAGLTLAATQRCPAAQQTSMVFDLKKLFTK